MATLNSKLKAIQPKDAPPSKPKILVFGKPGVGKTWTSLDFPSCYYIDTEGGADLSHYTDKLRDSGGVYLGQEQGSLDFPTVISQVQALATEQHPYKTLIIDSVSKLFNTCIAEEAERLGDKNAFGADKKPALAMMRRLVAWLDRLDMNVILIAHEKTEWGLIGGQRQEVGQTYDCWDKMAHELHLSLNIIKQGPQRLARVCKTRLQGFPDASIFPWSYEEFAKRYGRDVMEKEATAIDLATPEQVRQIEELLQKTRLAETDYREKALKKAKAETLAEMASDKAEALINHLKTLPTFDHQ